MKRILAVVAIIGLFSSVAFAGPVKTYQVTGPVLEVTSDMVAVKKGSDRWEIALGPDTKVTGDLKVGSKVTIEYRMTATKVDVKESAKAKTKGTPKTKILLPQLLSRLVYLASAARRQTALRLVCLPFLS